MGRLIYGVWWSGPGTTEAPERSAEGQTQYDRNWVVDVFNNDTNTYDEVIEVLMRATQCTLHEAYIEAWEIDHLGHSVVHHASEKECRRVAKVIAKIGIHVEVRQEE